MWRNAEGSFRKLLLRALAGAVCLGTPAFASMVITPTFTSNFVTNFGANAAAAENSWIAAANIFATNFSDNIHIQITVDAQAGTAIFGQSESALDSTTYGNLRNLVVGDARTPEDVTAIGAGGSITAADPTAGAGTWWVTTAEAKAIGLVADNLSPDGTTTFGAGNPFTFFGPVAPGTFDFEGVAAHEISEVLGRQGISGGTIGSTANSYSLLDLFSYTGAGVRGLTAGPGQNFSIDNGTTLIKLFNDATANHLDTRDWAAGGPNDSFNQFANSGVTNPVTLVDLRLMDAIGYDFIETPEPSTVLMLSLGGLAILGSAWRKRRVSLKK